MPRRPSHLSKEFSSKLALLEATRAKVEGLLPFGHLDIVDVEAVYSGLFIDAFTDFEALIERLFLGMFDGSLLSHRNPVSRLFRVSPKTLARGVVFEGKQYIDWLPIEDKTIPRAKRFLNQGLPFSSLDNSEKKILKDAHLLRNALAHKSDAATKGFLKSISQLTLLPQEKTPAGYLRTSPQGVSGLTRFSITINSLGSIATKLCS